MAYRNSQLEPFGFLFGKSGPHTARTLMLDELSVLLDSVDIGSASMHSFKNTITEDNCLSKQSGKTRELTFRHLKELYGLSPSIPLFRNLLYFWKREPEGRPLLAALCALPRDTIFRASYEWIEKFATGEQVFREQIEERITENFPGRFSPASLKSIAQNLNSSWTKTGHLQGRTKKIRAKAKPTAASTAFALYLGYLNGIRGEELFHSPYAKVLDARPAELMEKAETDELRLRARIDEFELATKEAGHEWHLFDLTNTFAEWLAAQRYAESYFKNPDLISTVLPKYQKFIVSSFEEFLSKHGADANSVVALQGVGSLFGLTKVKGIVDQLAPLVKGRLVVFFPGSYENNNYRLLDAYDGWGYLAVPITADKDH